MAYLITAFLVSLVATLLIVRLQSLHGRFTADTDLTGVQKFHHRPVPRVGGVALLLAMAAVILLALVREPGQALALALIWLCALPAFAGGLAEDVTKRVAARWRFAAIAVSGVLVWYVLGVGVTRLDIPGVDTLLRLAAVSFVVTLVAITGAANAVNIIDGYNGLAAVVSMVIFAGFAYVSFYLDDRLLVILCVGMMGAIAGFLVWNYPRAFVFLGDGGAYFIGYAMGLVSILLLARHPQVSAWFPLLLCFYPVFETLFSIYRKWIVRGRSPGIPDGVHLHMLVYRRLVRWVRPGTRAGRLQEQRNALTSPYLWVLSSLAGLPAVLFWRTPWLLMLFTFLFAVLYTVLYRALVLFRVPRWLVLRRK
ncbi:MAG: glycosyltransferase [Castellaniella sp.]